MEKILTHESFTENNDQLDLCIAMPAYNEEECIEKVIKEWNDGFSGLNIKYKLVVVNDGSRDKTLEKLKELANKIPELLILDQENQGHGVALRYAYDECLNLNPKWIFQTDSDDQFKFHDFGKLWEKRNDYVFLLGHRKNRHDPAMRLLITKILKLILKTIFTFRIVDANVPFRLLNTSYFRIVLKYIPKDFFAPNIFLTVLAYKSGLSVFVTPVEHIERQTGVVSIVSTRLLKACLQSFWELIKFRVGLTFIALKIKKEIRQGNNLD
ncbi:MAG: glycosyltransferase family 2 protein [Bacteriovoracaceae bacterium]|jgi:dolichol-phosphate mannosyltransferase|nr:glycosyltransferase family 2 protein [Bacteriovoracaceae bacterium]